ncbi:helix-turn-helix transcriptional regulator [Streptomyces sp. H10-C2]|uniref:helix-turn-helix domain-containing protein n=1 Tax=unclassified Streptomyces TaxID=2593676 RepID=UPI0024B8D2DE|nr:MULTISPECIES: helix-turn-helix transcriptional regulator [unclassified Streptomyces]MDJ0342625.1 helix-turn-helix transcriptional regulator [Streptomyces sp. PH10-H1]MDJ0368521.1 helix-turn-helix transcriptional regulator [Streptomyces sp. H10-C2]
MTENLTIGERVAWYRRRRGLSQEVLAGLVGRTTDWLSKAENNRIELDRLSVITSLAQALDVSLGDLLAEPALMEWSSDSGHRTVPALREALMDYRQLTPLLRPSDDEPPALKDLRTNVKEVLDAYQASRYGFATRRLPLVLADALAASRAYSGRKGEEAHALLALIYQGAAMVLGKVGEPELAWIAAERGLAAAQLSGQSAVTGSLLRAVTHCVLSTGRFTTAIQLVNDAAAVMQPELNNASNEHLSVYGTLFLTGAMAAARAEDRATTQTFLREADETAQRLGADANHMWTAFGPTNVAIHCVATAGELGDIQVAADLGPRIDTSGMPVERRVRHSLEVARALSAWNRTDDALATLLDAEQAAPEQVRHHYLSRELVIGWMRGTRGRPSQPLADLARRLRVVAGG